jgi:anti-sigma B factor antagonist
MSSCACVQQPQFLSALIKEPTLKLSLDVRENSGKAVVYCKGRIVYRDEAAALSAKVLDVLSRTSSVVIDLSGVEIMDTTGLGELIAVLNYAKARGSVVKLAAPNRRVYSLLELFKLTSLFEIHPTLTAAIAEQSAVLATAQC